MVIFTTIGTLDLLPKVGYPSLQQESISPICKWWDNYLIKSTYDDVKLLDGFCIIDTIDSEDQQDHWFIIRDLCPINIDFPTTINYGRTPCILGVAESTKPKSGNWVHVGMADKRKDMGEKIDILSKISSEVYIVVSLFGKLLVCDYMTKE